MSSSNDSNKVEEASDSPDDPLVEVPRLGGTFELVKKSHITRMDVKGMLIRCTSCLQQINHFDPDKFMKHFRLNVIVCKECYDFYGTSEFSQDDEGNYNYCAWCGNGGKLFLCDFCPNSFCSNCVRRNFGRAEVSRMSREGWKCYLCNPQKLKAKVEFCDLILEYSKNLKNRKERKSAAENLISKISGPLSWTETTDWVLPAFDELDDSCKTFHKRLEKLKSIGSSQSKSLKHVIKKMEQVIAQHKTELGQIIKTLSMRYVKYLDQKMKSENKKDSDPKDSIKENGADGENTRISIDITSDNDENNKAKLELLAFSMSSDSDSENENKSAVEEKDDDNSVTNNSNKATEKVIQNAKPDSEKDKVGGKSSDKDEPMEVDDTYLQSQDLFENGTFDTEGVKKPVISIVDDSDHAETETQSKAFKPKCSVTNKAKAAQPGRRKLNFSDLEAKAGDSSSSVSGLDSDAEGNRKKQVKGREIPTKARNVARRTKKVDPYDLHNDELIKLKNGCSVVLNKCDHLVPNGEMTIPLPEEFIIEDVDKELTDLCKSITKNQRVKSKATPAPSSKKKESGSKKKAVVISDASSSSICLSSDEDEKKDTKDRFPKTLKMDNKNTLAKKALLNSDSDESSDPLDSDSDEEAPKKKTNQKKDNKAKSDSSDDFQPKKKKKFDKLLNKKIFSDDDSSKDNEKKEKKQTDKKKSSKRKHVSSEDDKKEKKEKEERNNSDSVRTSSSDSEDEKEKKKKKRKRIKKAAASSSENEDKDDKDQKGSQSQGTPGKHRKNIKKIITGKNLAVETKEAQNAEKERRKRVTARQKQYNIITDTSKDGTHAITRKMVLEVDQVSKEEIVEVHPDLCEKLKPHQVNGVRFMWECTIESLKELETGQGSGCILAHCMGLGKTLQVITFLHTCLTNEHVSKKIQTALVICPYNTILNWAREFEYWLDKVDGDVLVHQLTDGKDNYSRLDILKYWQRDGGVLIASYDIFRRMATEKKLPKLPKKSMEKLREILIDPGPDIVVCDEGHILKNVNSAISKACAKIATERRIVLTGTPLQNNLQEYHCMLSFVKPHLLGTAKEFRNRFVNPIINGQYEDSNEYDVRRMKKRIHILHKLLEGCVQRCDYSALTKFLPPKHEFVISVKCSETQIKMYRHYLDNLSQRKADRKIQGGTLFADYNVLRNLCTHPYIVHTSYERAEERRMMNGDSSEEEFINDESEESAKGSKSDSESSNDEIVKQYKTRSRKNETGDEEEEVAEATKEKRWYHEFISDEDRYRLDLSGKMVLLMEILKECEAIGDKVILFSQSLLTLDLVEDILNHVDEQELSEEDKARDISCTWVEGLDYFRMDGTTSAELRKRYIDMFNSPDNDRARLFLVSTKAGGLGTNLVGANRVIMLDASWNPSHDVQAIFRVYRFGQKKPVYIYRLLAQGTMEEKIYDRQVTKLSLSIRVVDEQQIDRHFNAAELAELYNFTPDSTTDRPTPMLPKDTLLAEMLIKYNDWIVTYHEHDSLLQNENEADLTEEERQAAWNEYENEREGRTTMFENNMDADLSEYGREPDYTQADYVGTMIPTSKDMIEKIISDLKTRYPNLGPVDLRKKLLMSLHTLRQVFQEKHVKFLRLKQEYVARGSVPLTINKYLQELNRVLEELSKHCENIQKLVQEDYAKMQQEMARRAQAARAAQAAAQAVAQANAANLGQGMPYGANVNFASSRLPNGVNHFPPFARMHQNLQARMSQFPGGPHPGLSNNFRMAGDQRWNTAGNINTGGARVFPSSSKHSYAPRENQPVITEVDEDKVGGSENSGYNNPPSTIVIEEMD